MFKNKKVYRLFNITLFISIMRILFIRSRDKISTIYMINGKIVLEINFAEYIHYACTSCESIAGLYYGMRKV